MTNKFITRIVVLTFNGLIGMINLYGENPELDWNMGKPGYVPNDSVKHTEIKVSNPITEQRPEVKKTDSVTETSSEWVQPDDYKNNIERATQGHPEAQRKVGRAYQSGIGVKPNLQEAWKWLARAAGSGDTEAQYQLGVMYRDGVGVKRSSAEAAHWFRRAARNGHTLALLNMGVAFENGEGVLLDNRVASENYWRAAERGSAEGAYRYAMMMKTGKSGQIDKQRALKYFIQAADANYPDAQQQVNELKAQGIKLPAAAIAPKKTTVNKPGKKPSTTKSAGKVKSKKKKKR